MSATESVKIQRLKINEATSLSCLLLLAATGLLLAPGFGQGKAPGRSVHPLASAHKSSRLTGTYTRIKRHRDENQSAILAIKQISAVRIKLHLTALWWPVGNADSPHNGEIEATVALHNHVAVYKNGDYRLTLRFRDHTVVLTESGSNPDFGVNVSAAGAYRQRK